MDCLWTTLPPIWSEHAHSSVYNQMVFVIAMNDFDGLRQLIVRFFLCPQLIWIPFAFLLRVHCIAPRWSTFQGVSRSVDVILVKDFANSIDILLVWQSFCSIINSHTSKIMSIQSLVCWNEIRDVLFWKDLLKIKLFLSKIQHTLFEIYSPLIVMYFENRNWPVVRLKWLFFFMVLCIHFRLWFWGISFDGLWWGDLYVNFKNKTQVKSQALSREVVSFWAFILSACIITNSLIHEVTTLIEKLFKFWERHLSVQIVCLIKKGF